VDIVLPAWDCVVPAGASCTLASHGSCTKTTTTSDKLLCSDVQSQYGEQTGLEWCIAGGTKDQCNMIEMNVVWPGQNFCLNSINGNMHSGFTDSYSVAIYKADTNYTTPACRDYGMAMAIGDYSKARSCPAGMKPLGSPDIPKTCNTYACYCPGEYMGPTNCQVATPCQYVYDRMWTLINAPTRSYACHSYCRSHKGVPNVKGCGWDAPAPESFGIPTASNEWYTDDHQKGAFGSHWGLGIFQDPSCRDGLRDQKVDLKITTCNIEQRSTDEACCCGQPGIEGVACSSSYSMCGKD